MRSLAEHILAWECRGFHDLPGPEIVPCSFATVSDDQCKLNLEHVVTDYSIYEFIYIELCIPGEEYTEHPQTTRE